MAKPSLTIYAKRKDKAMKKIQSFTLALKGCKLPEETKATICNKRYIPMQTNRDGMLREFEILLTPEQIKRHFVVLKKHYRKLTRSKYLPITKDEALRRYNEDRTNIQTNGIGVSRESIPLGARIWKNYKNKSVLIYTREV